MHDHEHDHEHEHDEKGHRHFGLGHFHAHGGEGPQMITRAIVITVIFMLIEFAGGWYANSLALLSDAAHMLTDVGAMLLSLFAIWVSRRPRTPTMSFGYHRAEILGALASGLVIWLLAGLLVFEAVMRLQSPEPVQGPVVFFVAAIGLTANILSMRTLHSAKQENMNVRAAYLHVISDALGSIGAVIAGAVLWATGWQPIDPIVTLLFAGLMLYSSWHLVKEAVGILMESTPGHLDPAEVTRSLEQVPGVKEVHDLHIWQVGTGRLALSVHLIAEQPEGILSSVNEMLESKYSISHTTIQVEHPDRFHSERCYDCADPKLKGTY